MKTDFHLSNLLGTVYRKGNLLFTPDGTHLLSPVGNRITVFDLTTNKSHILPSTHRKNISHIALTPRGNLILSIDEDGHAILTNLLRRVVLFHFSFRSAVSTLSFSPSGRHFAVGIDRFVELWHTPSTPVSTEEGVLEFAPFVRHRIHAGHHDIVHSIQWSSDSRFFLSASKDFTARIWSLSPEEGFVPTTLAAHHGEVLAAWFSKDQESIYTVSRDGAFFRWAYALQLLPNGEADQKQIEEPMRWRVMEKHYFSQAKIRINCAVFHALSGLLVVGSSSGIFSLYELPDFTLIHTLSISQSNIDCITINSSGDWLAFGTAKLGQLLVWEWQSESYILKQQGHFDSITSLTYSPDGEQIITAADDGKIKVWDIRSGFCIVTFTEHSAAVTACKFAKRGKVLFTASLDGSIRAWDLIRYRNFRTFTAPTRQTFSSIAVDPSVEVICAGSLESFDVHVWSVQTGQLLDQLAGHEAPVAALAFAPNGTTLVSGSWDRTIRMWNIFGRTQISEPIQLQADVLDIAVRPDSKQVAVSTLDGQLSFWSLLEPSQQGGVDGRRDASGGRKLSDRRTAAKVAGSKAFDSIAYSVDGSCVVACGKSKFICLYDVQSGTLIKKFTVSVNLALDGTQEYLNSGNLSEAGPLGLIDTYGESANLEDRLDHTLPGATRGDLSVRSVRPDVRVSAIAFSPSGEAFCAASTEGLLVYSLDTTKQFDPVDLDMTVTPTAILSVLRTQDYLTALIMAFRLAEPPLTLRVYESTPVINISLIVRNLPAVYLPELLKFIAQVIDESPHLEFNLLWIKAVVTEHGKYLRTNAGKLAGEMRSIQKGIERLKGHLVRISESNIYKCLYLMEQGGRKLHKDGPRTKAVS